jgi:hypothetical protein
MRILYVAKHNSGDNDDEGAIAHALGKLGHEVIPVHEMRRRREGNAEISRWAKGTYDFCLFHKWETVSELAEVAQKTPCAFWYFDMIANDDDPTLAVRMQTRRRWFNDVMPHCVTAFLTDGDWVDYHNGYCAPSRKVHWLMQGTDERYVGLGVPQPGWDFPEILFTGTRHHGRKREEHIAELEARYGHRFGVIGEVARTGHISRRVHGRELADLFASVKVVVAPDGPCTDRYWSNRVYLTCGLGGFLIHPRCKGLWDHYHPEEIVTYTDRDHLHDLIRRSLDPANEESRQGWRKAGLRATIHRNLYRHRCQELVAKMKELL